LVIGLVEGPVRGGTSQGNHFKIRVLKKGGEYVGSPEVKVGGGFKWVASIGKWSFVLRM